MFNPQEFLSQQNTDGKFETQFTPIPAGEYIGLIQKLDAKEQSKPDGSGVWTIVDIQIQIDDARAKDATGLPNPMIKDSLFLDIENGKLATGKNKNVALGRYLEAVGANGQPGNPFQHLQGKMVKVQCVVEPDKKDSTKLYTRVKAVGKAQ